MSNVYQRVSGAKVGRSVFNLSYEKKFTADMGLLYPVMCDEVVPGDIMNIGCETVIRMQPLVAPMLHEVNCFVHYFFVPYRLLWDEWEDFITGGEDGESAPTPPTWEPTTPGTTNDFETLWDYLGFPVNVDPDGAYPLDFPRRAYNFIYNEFYRDENLITEVSLTSEDLHRRAWLKDRFTSALPWQQRGTAPALPISGQVVSSAVFPTANFVNTGVAGTSFTVNGSPQPNLGINSSTGRNYLETFFNDNEVSVDFSNATTFDISDLRLAFQIQKWMERNARAGARYTEFLRAHFNEAPRDDRLDRPEFIGGSRNPIIISEVLQTGETGTTPQGNLAGHGIGVNKKFAGKYRVKEFGLIMGLMSIMPKPAYHQGINKQWLRKTKYDFYFPEFAHLSEEAILQAELYASGVSSENNTVFGYQGRYDEMRIKENMVCGQLRPGGDLDYWTLVRDFASAPLLNSSFISCTPSKRTFAVQDENTMIISHANIIKAIRPMPISADPGYIDH